MLKIIVFISNIVPLLVLVVRLVEASADGLTSDEKKHFAMEAVETFATAFGITIPQNMREWVSTAIDLIVSVLNAVGIFKHADEE